MKGVVLLYFAALVLAAYAALSIAADIPLPQQASAEVQGIPADYDPVVDESADIKWGWLP